MWGSDPTTHALVVVQPDRQGRDGSTAATRCPGRWSFSSGCDHCEAVNLGAIAGCATAGGTRSPDFRSFLLHARSIPHRGQLARAGLKGTGSKDIVVDATFVPEHRTQSHLDYAFNLPLPGQELNDGPLYRLPWSVVFNMALAASVLGSAQGFIDAVDEQTATARLRARMRARRRPVDASGGSPRRPGSRRRPLTRMRADADRAVADGRGRHVRPRCSSARRCAGT